MHDPQTASQPTSPPRSTRAPGLTVQQRTRLAAETACTPQTIGAVYLARPTKSSSYSRVQAAAERLGLPLPPPHVPAAR